jgi:hypothetical protein
MAKSMQELQSDHERKMEANRSLGVQEYKSGEKQSDQVWEVTAGRKYLPDGKGKQKVLGPGHLFHPTERQVETGVLEGKAREVPASVLRGLSASGDIRSTGADIGIRALPMAESTVRRALQAGMTEADFEGVEPEGQDGQYTFRQVEAMIAARDSETTN